ncbi:hypothetical protein LF1_33990 [Rubripirellula obstinata]|uniref:Peptidase M48 domain-containing protein n=1 Tax=Rubripirellula obstinata TaxID=406547 RepID=A0A5B1CI20_9BACT|nr:M48 family metallopeptidase [Rubripirellula obstinata]KAA1260857.1 hypothetical protein LF1_33990 [Rubripirellula obstinata]
MATDFFQRQSEARRSTTWLIGMFCIAVICIVGLVVAVATVVMMQVQVKSYPVAIGDRLDQGLEQAPEQFVVPLIAGIVTLLIISGGTLFKIAQLQSGGGTSVAENLGGKRIYPNTTDRVERRLMNVVEEMALASGTPVPPVFLLEEPGINAFAAGYSPSDAVLGITRGCAEQLTRDELQGVVAHEFSHVLNGDMRMSIRLIGILHGILLIGLTGQLIFRMFIYSGGSRRRSSNNNNGGQAILVMMAIAVALLVLGFVGTFFGNLIKAAVSRQREYLADASAVQFTRNPAGIADALKRIGGFPAGSRLNAAHAAEASHMYFSQGVWEGISGLWATHPPLKKRILAIEPGWKGGFLESGAQSQGNVAPGAAGFAGQTTGTTQASWGSSSTNVPISIVDHAVDHVGEPNQQHRDYAADLIASLPTSILENVREPYSARAIVYCLLMDHKRDIRALQMQILAKHAKPDVVTLVGRLQSTVDELDVRARLPIVDMALPSLRAMSQSQFNEFRNCFIHLAKADQQIDLFEWTLAQVLMRHLRSQFEQVKPTRTSYYNLKKLGPQCATLLSVVASAGNPEDVAQLSFARGAAHLPELQMIQQPSSGNAMKELRDVLSTLSTVVAKERGRVVDACAAAICADDHVTWQEAELLRGISDLLDCPMPPLLVSDSLK